MKIAVLGTGTVGSTLGTKLVQAARMREETRGSHWREDFPETDDVNWLGHIDIRSDSITYRPGVSS